MDLDARDRHGKTLLMSVASCQMNAARYGDVAKARLLVQHHKHIGVITVKHCELDLSICVEAAEAGADPNLTANGRTALDLAEEFAEIHGREKFAGIVAYLPRHLTTSHVNLDFLSQTMTSGSDTGRIWKQWPSPATELEPNPRKSEYADDHRKPLQTNLSAL